MFFVWIGLALVIAKLMSIDPITGLSWIYVLAPLALAFLWFEVIESALGFDKRKKAKQAEDEQAKKERLRAQFAEPQPAKK